LKVNAVLMPKPRPLFSIIIPSYNRANELKRAIKSVISQTCTDWEMLIIDNKSTDETQESIDGFADARIRKLTIQNHGIIAKSRNLGVRKAKGEFIAFLDSDDWWREDKLEKCYHYILSNFDIVSHSCYLVRSFTEHPFQRVVGGYPKYRTLLQSFALQGNFVINSSVVVRKQLLIDCGLISEDHNLVTVEDFDTWLKLAATERNWFFEREPLGFYFVGNTNLSKSKTAVDGFLALVKKHSKLFNQVKVEYGWNTVDYVLGKGYLQAKDYSQAHKRFSLYLSFSTPAFVTLKSIVYIMIVGCLRLKSHLF
jgi:glycosyltransferase involved in cell wall biosynthesis